MPPRKRKIIEESIEEEQIILPKKGIPKWIGIILFLLLLVSAGVFAWSVYSNRAVTKNISKQQNEIETELQRKQEQAQKNKNFIEAAGKLILLPAGEQPVIATITDAEKLKLEGNFYANAKNGDIILVYPVAKKAFIYDPQNNIIVNVGPVISENVEKPAEPIKPVATTTASEQIKIEVRNGTSIARLAARLADKLKTNPLFNVVKTSDTEKPYEKTLLVVLTDKKTDQVKALEKELGVTAVTKIPAGEGQSTAEAVVIIGENYDVY